MIALAPHLGAPQLPDEVAYFVQWRVWHRLRYLEEVGLLERDAADEYVVPDALRGVIARALIMVSTALMAEGEE